ncbi:hypothetical protein [Actinacidiphila rubida]|uniref:hypothetical protein n=1 Tax=Actinacidiphila rubida TaxID=310780 RepID=UPI00114D13AF|nr:hypothetical protein [Actinacidiphila rubida]
MGNARGVVDSAFAGAEVPLSASTASRAASAYLGALEWPLTLGHSTRPGLGCTCQRAGCATPGAHPRPGPLTYPRSAGELLDQLEAEPGAALIAPTVGFDALVMRHEFAMRAILELERLAPVPCIVNPSGDRAVLLVLLGTGHDAVEGVEHCVDVRTGPDAWIALPPTRSLAWDTPPWFERTDVEVPLLHGNDVGRHLWFACRTEAGNR